MDDAQDLRQHRGDLEQRERAALGWKRQPVGLGVSRCPVDVEDGLPLRANLGYVEPRGWRERIMPRARFDALFGGLPTDGEG